MNRSRYAPLAALLAVLAACTLQTEPTPPPPSSVTPSSTPTPYTFTADDFPTLDGSTANIPLASLILQRLDGVPKARADNLQFSGTSQAYIDLACPDDESNDDESNDESDENESNEDGPNYYQPNYNQPTDQQSTENQPAENQPAENPSTKVVLAYEPPQETKDQIKPSPDGCKEIEYHPIGRDALVFLANTKNPVDSLTTAQYKNIYAGKLTKWSQVGGKKQQIVAYQRPESSGSQALLRKFVMGKTAMMSAPVKMISGEMGKLIKNVAEYENSGNALGYSVYYYAKEMYAAPGIKLLGADGVQPSSDTIADGSYPYVNDFYAAIRADEPENSPARRLVAWLESPDGQQTVLDAGYVPVPGVLPASARPSQPSPPKFTPIPMPAPGGGPMLWPIPADYYGDTRYGFINAKAKPVRPANYVSYDYCTDASGNPKRLVALNSNNSVEVLSLDGSVVRTIPALSNLTHEPPDGVACQNNREIWFYFGWGYDIYVDKVYNIDTGKFGRSLGDKIAPWKSCLGSVDDPEDTEYPEDTRETPPDYDTWLNDEWAMNEEESTAINVVTSAVIHLGETGASAVGPYLLTDIDNSPAVYTRDGKLTSLSSVRTMVSNSICSDEPTNLPFPYYWATSGRIQGYVDARGIWYYQENIDQTLGDD